MNNDRIEKKILLHAPRPRVWRALTDSVEFGAWFGVKFNGPFTPGARMKGKLVGTTVDSNVAKAQKQYEDIPFEITIDRIEAERLFSFRWHPYAVERGVDYSHEPTTLIVFTLEEAKTASCSQSLNPVSIRFRWRGVPRPLRPTSRAGRWSLS